MAVYTDDVEHDDVGMPGGPLIGKEAARRFYKEAVIEFDLGGLLIDSPDREMTGAVVAEIDGGTVNGRAGRQLARLLAEAGLRDVRARGEPVQPGYAFLERIYQPALARLAGRNGRLVPRLEVWSERLRADAAASWFFAAAPVMGGRRRR